MKETFCWIVLIFAVICSIPALVIFLVELANLGGVAWKNLLLDLL
jgi:hypothetical protein